MTGHSTVTGTATAPALRGHVHQTLFVAQGCREVQALLTIDAAPAGPPVCAGPPEAAEVIVLDASTSMLAPGGKFGAAADAAVAAIEVVRDGVLFAVLAGTGHARPVWPPGGGLRPAGPDTRAAAAAALRATVPGGDTRIGNWLRAVTALLDGHPGAIRHAILVTDGHDELGARAALDDAIRCAAGVVSCDCRGVGDDWRFDELHAIAGALHGTVGRVADPSGLADDFRRMMEASMRKAVAQVALRLWTPAGARVELVEQSAPQAVDLTPRRVDAGPQVGLYPTGPWGPEQRDFRVAVEVPPAEPGRTRIAARASFVHVAADGTVTPLDQQHTRRRPDGREETRSEAWVSATWAADPGADTRRAGPVRHAETEKRIAGTIRSAMALLETGADAEAESLLRSARTWAGEIRDAGLVRRIDDLFDPETDTFRAGGPTRGERHELEIETTRRPVQRRPRR